MDTEKTPLVLNYEDIRLKYINSDLLLSEKKLKSLKKSISLGAGLNSVGSELHELILNLRDNFLANIVLNYENEYDLIIKNNPFSEALFILSKMYYEKGRKSEGDEYRKMALSFDPNNPTYINRL